jgi:hypothetical protein
MAGSASKRPEPSYKTGKLRDKSIAKKQHPDYKPEHLHRLIRKSIKKD